MIHRGAKTLGISAAATPDINLWLTLQLHFQSIQVCRRHTVQRSTLRQWSSRRQVRKEPCYCTRPIRQTAPPAQLLPHQPPIPISSAAGNAKKNVRTALTCDADACAQPGCLQEQLGLEVILAAQQAACGGGSHRAVARVSQVVAADEAAEVLVPARQQGNANAVQDSRDRERSSGV